MIKKKVYKKKLIRAMDPQLIVYIDFKRRSHDIYVYGIARCLL